MRLIDVDAACERCGAKAVGECSDECVLFMENLLTIDAVPVVRCKECRRRYDVDECPMCVLHRDGYFEYTADDGFCDRGERRVAHERVH